MGEIVEHPAKLQREMGDVFAEVRRELAALDVFRSPEEVAAMEQGAAAGAELAGRLSADGRERAARLLDEAYVRDRRAAYQEGYQDGLADRRPAALVTWLRRRRPTPFVQNLAVFGLAVGLLFGVLLATALFIRMTEG